MQTGQEAIARASSEDLWQVRMLCRPVATGRLPSPTERAVAPLMTDAGSL